MNESNIVILMLDKAPSVRYFAFLGERLLKQTTYEPVFWGNEDQIAALTVLGISGGYSIDFSSSTARSIGRAESQATALRRRGHRTWRTNARESLRKYVANPNRSLTTKVFFHVLIILRSRMRAYKLIKRLRPRAVFVWGDNGGLTAGDFLRICNKAGITVIHCPVALSQQEIIAYLRLRHSQFHAHGDTARWVAKMIRRFFPHQTFEYKRRELFYHSLDSMLAMILTGCLTPRPWVLGMSRANEVLFATSWEAAYWTQRGLSPKKASVVGFYELDIIRNGKVAARPRNASGRNTIVYGVPNFAEHNVFSLNEQCRIVEGHLAALSGTGCNLILVLHPKSSLADYVYLEEMFDCRIHRATTPEALPLCDMYVCVGSTTGLWAASLGIRVVDLSKMFGLEIPLFDEVPRITMVATSDELRAVLRGAFDAGRRLRENRWYVDLQAQAAYLSQPPVRDALIERLTRLG